MRFEFDPNKSFSNFSKHGIDFDVAQNLWNDPDLLEIPAKTTDEARHLVIAKIDGKHRGQTIRLISVRRSRPEEIGLYEG